MLIEIKFLIGLFVTLIIEIAIVVLLAKFVFRLKDLRNAGAIAIIASVLTLPYLWFVLPLFLPAENYLLFGEIIVIIVEALIYLLFTKLSWKQAAMASIVANAVSFYLGRFILSYL